MSLVNIKTEPDPYCPYCGSRNVEYQTTHETEDKNGKRLDCERYWCEVCEDTYDDCEYHWKHVEETNNVTRN